MSASPGLQKALSQRQLRMIAIGGVIGAGLFVGSGVVMADTGPGAFITYNITYTNVSTSNGDANCVKLTATNLVITEDGLAAPNNWGSFTTDTSTPSDSGSGVVVIVSATKYTDTIASLGPGASAVFTFYRLIN